MDYVRFGNSGLEVSRLCLGCMDFAERLDEREAQGVLDAALEAGINFIDTADAYGRGHNEEVVGRLIQGRRDDLVVATKLWVVMERGKRNRGGCSRIHLLRAVEDSLRRLQTDRIDLYMLHHPDPDTPAEETLSTMDTLVKQGKVRYWGVSNHYAWQLAHYLGLCALHGWEPPISLQCRYNIFDRVIETETVHFCRRFNIATMIYGPLDRGILTPKYQRGEEPPEGSFLARSKAFRARLTPELFDARDPLEAIAARHGILLNQLAVAWLLAKPVVTSVILGGSEPEHFVQLHGCCGIELPADDIAAIDRISAAWRHGPFQNQGIAQGTPPALNRW